MNVKGYVIEAGANLRGADLYGAVLCDASVSCIKWPAPQIVLLAEWGHLSSELTRDLMNYDAASHPDPAAFDEWVAGGRCPYANVNVERAAQFRENKAFWDPSVPLCRPYDLMQRVIRERCEEEA